MNWAVLILFLTLSVSAQESYPVPQAEVYSEGAFWTGNSLVSNSVFARTFARFNQLVHPFLQMGVEQTFGEQGNGDLYISPGIHFQKKFISIFGEHRLHQRTYDNFETHEWRALFVVGDRLNFPIRRSWSFHAFWEPYTELLFSSNDLNNILFQGMSRVGLSYFFSSKLTTDIYLEPYLSFLQNRVGDSTQFQLRPSVRTQTCFESLCFSLAAARFLPISDIADQGFRFLATLRGSI